MPTSIDTKIAKLPEVLRQYIAFLASDRPLCVDHALKSTGDVGALASLILNRRVPSTVTLASSKVDVLRVLRAAIVGRAWGVIGECIRNFDEGALFRLGVRIWDELSLAAAFFDDPRFVLVLDAYFFTYNDRRDWHWSDSLIDGALLWNNPRILKFGFDITPLHQRHVWGGHRVRRILRNSAARGSFGLFSVALEISESVGEDMSTISGSTGLSICALMGGDVRCLLTFWCNKDMLVKAADNFAAVMSKWFIKERFEYEKARGNCSRVSWETFWKRGKVRRVESFVNEFFRRPFAYRTFKEQLESAKYVYDCLAEDFPDGKDGVNAILSGMPSSKMCEGYYRPTVFFWAVTCKVPLTQKLLDVFISKLPGTFNDYWYTPTVFRAVLLEFKRQGISPSTRGRMYCGERRSLVNRLRRWKTKDSLPYIQVILDVFGEKYRQSWAIRARTNENSVVLEEFLRRGLKVPAWVLSGALRSKWASKDLKAMIRATVK